MALAKGTRLGPYEVVDRIGSGGMGEVYRAHDDRLARDVAIKVLSASLATREDVARRFAVEGRAAAMLNHPNIMAIFDVGTHDGGPYVVCELLDGESLRDRLEQGPLPVPRAIDFAIQIARGLAAAHDKGIVHRDLKPENLFLLRDGRVKILDFGIAKVRTGADSMPGPTETASGVILGTIGYMAPEQLTGGAVDHRADLFALGLILHEMVAGERPFGNANAMERVVQMSRSAPPPIAGVPAGLSAIVRHCLELAPADRFESARDLAFGLEALAVSGAEPTRAATVAARPAAKAANAANAAGAPPRGGRRGLLVAGLVIAAGAGVAAGYLLRSPATPRAVAAVGTAALPGYRQLSFRRGTVLAARFTPDGNLVYAAAWDGGPSQLYRARLDKPDDRAPNRTSGASAGAKEVPKRSEAQPLGDGELFAVSKHQLALARAGTLVLTESNGKGGRDIATGVLAADFAPDGRLALARRTDAGIVIEYPAGTELVTLAHAVSDLRVAPDGASLAYVEHSGAGDGGLVMLCDQRGQTRPLTEAWASVHGLAWAPDGGELWFSASAAGPDLAVRAVTPAGQQRVVVSAPGRLRLLDVGAGGRALIAAEHWTITPMVLRPGGEEPRALSWRGQSRLGQLGSDGKVFTFAEGQDGGAYLRSTAGADPTRLGDGIPVGLSPDGTRVLMARAGGVELLRIGGKAASIDCDGRPVAGALFDGDGDVLAVCVDGDGPRLYDRIDGALEPLLAAGVLETTGGAVNAWLSPDGARLVTTTPPHMIHPLDDTGSFKEVPGLRAGDVLAGWAAGGRELYVASQQQGRLIVEMLDPATGGRRSYRTIALADRTGLAGIRDVQVTLDGRALAYSDERVLSALYLVDGLK